MGAEAERNVRVGGAAPPGRSCCGVRAAHTLGVSEAPPGDNRNHQEASRKEQTLPGSLCERPGGLDYILCALRGCTVRCAKSWLFSTTGSSVSSED